MGGGGGAINPKIVQKSRNNILKKSFQEVSACFREVSAYFREVCAYFRAVSGFQNFETSFEKFGAIVATGGLQCY